ncbi:MAG: type II toxin-antitoxin system VapC family toxin [Planctomycetes bacterium]|nr:type II toxin-antitoxin system VapC family toxin [Planctomycetota bacterium]
MRALFVDSGVWIGCVHESDPLHARAKAILDAPTALSPIANELILSESTTLLRRVLSAPRVTQFARDLIDGRTGTLVRSETSDWREALRIMEKYADQRISFADAVSIAMIRRLNIEKVASFDKHFKIVLPDREIFGM